MIKTASIDVHRRPGARRAGRRTSHRAFRAASSAACRWRAGWHRRRMRRRPSPMPPIAPTATRSAPMPPLASGRSGPGPMDVGPSDPADGLGPMGPGPMGIWPDRSRPDGVRSPMRRLHATSRIARPNARTASGSSGIASRARARRARSRDVALRAGQQRHLRSAMGPRGHLLRPLADLKGTRADAALYWKAYAQNRLGQRADALATIAELDKGYPNSRYLKEAKALEVEVRGAAGQPVRPEAQADEDLKLMAMQAPCQQRSRRQAVPMLEKMLNGTASPRLKERALYVLAQMNTPKAREILTNVAKGGSIPELQSRAIQYLGVHGGTREPGRARGNLRVDDRRRREAPHPARLHGRWREGPAAGRRTDGTESRAPGRSRASARRDGRQRRAVADVSEGNVDRRQAADAVGRCRSAATRRG